MSRNSGGSRPGSAPPRKGAAAELAWGLELWCRDGLRLRASGRCSSRQHSRGSRGVRRTREHDAGCRALGIPLAEIRRELDARDGVSASALLYEAVVEAVDEISEYGDAWTAQAAAEALAYALRRRITPRAPPH